jgi:hypothetical protein
MPSDKAAAAAAAAGKTLPCVCAVCGDGASEHLHYGAICCFSCRAFFRRYADREKCVCVRGDASCVIDTNRRNDCMHCRLKKCYSIGMKKVRKHSSIHSTLDKNSSNKKRVKTIFRFFFVYLVNKLLFLSSGLCPRPQPILAAKARRRRLQNEEGTRM